MHSRLPDPLINTQLQLGGSAYAADKGNAEEGALKKRMETELRDHFRPEFLNRIDDIVLFKKLGLPEIERIVELQLERVAALIRPRGMTFKATAPARTLLAREAFDPIYGARPLKRNIQKLVQDPLALKILAGEMP